MLNLTLDQRHLSAFRNVHHKRSKNFNLQSCVSTSKENQIQQRSHSNSRLSSHFPLDHVDSCEMFSKSVLYLAQNWMRDTVLFAFRNRKLDMLVVETLPKLFM